MRKSLKQLFAEEKKPIGMFVNTACPEMVEITAKTGFDFVFIDNEHGSWGIETNAHLVRAAESFDCVPLIRVPNIDENAIKHALDIGAAGVVIPGISSVADVREAMKWAKFAPVGRRGACPYVRANGYTGKSENYFEDSNRDVAVILLIEGKDGVEAYDDILNEEDVEFVFFGPYDLSVSLGIPGQLDDPRVKDAIKEMIRKAKAKGVYSGMLGIDPADTNEWFDCGVDYVVQVGDMSMYYRMCEKWVKGVKEA